METPASTPSPHFPSAALSCLLLTLVVSVVAPLDAAAVVVVRSSKLPAHDQALKGLTSALQGGEAVLTVLDLTQTGAVEELRSVLTRKPDVVVALGSAALDAVNAVNHASPVVATMLLGVSSGQPPLAAITLDVPPAAVLAKLKQLYPKRKRLAVMRGPALSVTSAAKLEALAQSYGYKVVIVDCLGPKQLLSAISSLRDKFDFAWCLPDGSLYQGPTLSAALLEAIRNGVAIIGFSEGAVRAGALVGFYADYEDIGRQTAEAVNRHLQGAPTSRIELPRKVRAAVNERVMRVLGIEHTPDGAETTTIK